VVIQNQTLEIPQIKGFPYKEHLNKGNFIAVFDSASVTIYPIVEWIKPESSKEKYYYRTKISSSSRRKINPVIIKTMFGKNSFYLTTIDILEKWCIFSIAIESPPSLLNIKEKENSYLRLIYNNPSKEFFIESYIKWNEWLPISQELEHLKTEINLCIKNNQMQNINEKFDCIKNILNRILIQAEIPIPPLTKEISLSRINIIFSNRSVFFPIELIENLLVQYKIPVFREKHGEKKRVRKISFIYSEELLHSFDEVKKITTSFEKDIKIEIFQDKNYKDYKHNLRSSDIIHFTGHGKAENNYGTIIMDNESIDHLYHIQNPLLIFLNSCHSGLFTEGIVKNLINNNTCFVIASPYEIPDAYTEDYISDFYSLLNPDDIEITYHLNSFKNPLFKIFYRLYSGYNNKIS